MAAHRIEHVVISRLRLPLQRPYALSFRTLHHFDSFLVTISARGLSGQGETTPLPGYSSESPETVMTDLNAWGRELVGLTLEDALERMSPRQRAAPFAATAMITAVESALGRCPAEDRTLTIPLLKTLYGQTPPELAAEVEAGLASGYTTFKFKVGWDPDQDAARVQALQRALAGRGAVRLDANQGWNLEQARRFCRQIQPEGIELLEQPFPPDRWDWMAVLRRETGLPLMLDESIHGEEDVDRVIESGCAAFVKFKLMKAGSMSRLESLIQRARAGGLQVVVGNGVATDLGNYHEARVAGPHLATAAELNGFLKLRAPLFAEPIPVQGARVVLPATYRPAIDPARLAAVTVQETEWSWRAP